MTHLVHFGRFRLASGRESALKFDCDALVGADWAALAALVAPYFSFGRAVGVPTGGLAFAEALRPYADPSSPGLLIVDDVLTTGGSIARLRDDFLASGAYTYEQIAGVVFIARGRCPKWVSPVLTLAPWAEDL